MPAKKTTIVVADDDPQLLRLVARNLELAGYDVLTADDGQVAIERIEARQPDLVVLDVTMPRLDGFAVCRRVREFSTVPILFLTSRGRDEDKVLGLDAGGDDYLTKPFSVEELLARVRAVLRRAEYPAGEGGRSLRSRVDVGALTVDFARHRVTMDGREVALTPVEYRLLAYLAQHIGRHLTQDALLEHVWGPEYVGENHLLQVHIHRLRHKLEPDPASPRYIVTRIGVGYTIPEAPAAGPAAGGGASG